MLVSYLDAVVEATRRATALRDQLKLAMGASGTYDFAALFPEAFGKSEGSEESEESVEAPVEDWLGGATWDYSGVSWQAPGESEEAELEALIAQASSGSLTGDALAEDSWR